LQSRIQLNVTLCINFSIILRNILAHFRSQSSIIPTIISLNNDDSNSLVKLRSSGIGELVDEKISRKSNEHLNQSAGRIKNEYFLNLPNSNLIPEFRISQNSFGSDSNLMQSASKAALACRESIISLKDEENTTIREAIKSGQIGGIFKWIVQKDIDLNGRIQFDGGALFSTLLHSATENVKNKIIKLINLSILESNNFGGISPIEWGKSK